MSTYTKWDAVRNFRTVQENSVVKSLFTTGTKKLPSSPLPIVFSSTVSSTTAKLEIKIN